MTDAPLVPAEKLEQLGRIPTQTLIDALWVKQWPQAMIHGARPLFPGRRMAGRAVTLRFVPHRPDVAADKPKGEASPEYVAFELCGPEEVLVVSSLGPWESIGGDIKFLRLFQRQAAGLVTDGSVRDSGVLRTYGFPIYCHSTTAKQGPAVHWPWGVNEVIACGGSAGKCEKLRAIGADHAIDTSREDFVAAIHARYGKPRIWGGGGVDVVVNYIGGETWTKSLRVLCRFGRMLVCGATAGYDPKEDLRYIWSFELRIIGSNSFYDDNLAALMELIGQGEMRPVIDRVLPLEQAREGLRLIQDREVIGKVLVVP